MALFEFVCLVTAPDGMHLLELLLPLWTSIAS